MKRILGRRKVIRYMDEKEEGKRWRNWNGFRKCNDERI